MLLLALGKYAGIHANGRKLGGERISNMWKNSNVHNNSMDFTGGISPLEDFE